MRMPRTSTFLGIKDAAVYLTAQDPTGGWTVSKINYYTFDSKRGQPIKKRRDHVTMLPQNIGGTLIFTKRQLDNWLKHNQWRPATKDETAFSLADVCRITGLNDEQVYYQLKTGYIAPQKVGGKYIYTYADIARLNLLNRIAYDANVLAGRVAAVIAERDGNAGAAETTGASETVSKAT